MEITGLLAFVSFFSFLYYMGRTREDWVLEIIAGFGYFMTGLLWTVTGVFFYGYNEGVLVRNYDATSQPWGILLLVISILLMLYTGNSILKKSEA